MLPARRPLLLSFAPPLRAGRSHMGIENPNFASPSRGEDGAPSLSPGLLDARSQRSRRKGLSNRGAPRWGWPVGMRANPASGDPTRRECSHHPHLGTPSDLARRCRPAATAANGGPNPWRSVLPPPGGGDSRANVEHTTSNAMPLALRERVGGEPVEVSRVFSPPLRPCPIEGQGGERGSDRLGRTGSSAGMPGGVG